MLVKELKEGYLEHKMVVLLMQMLSYNIIKKQSQMCNTQMR